MLAKAWFVLCTALLVAGCSRQQTGTAHVKPYKGELPIQGAWLDARLPAGTIAYLRIPNPLGLAMMPKGNVFDTALRSDANIRNAIAIQKGLAENLAGAVPLLDDPRFKALIAHLRSPVEAAIIGRPMQAAIVAATLDLRAAADLEMLIAQIGAPNVRLSGHLDKAGFGQLVGTPMPVFLHFDAANGRLALFGGQGATRDALAALLKPHPADAPQSMRTLEAQIDTSGQGLFAWIDAQQALAMGAGFMPPAARRNLQAARMLRALAFGAGVANGKGRLKIVADIGSDTANRMLPVVANDISAKASGAPTSVLLLSMPSAAEFARLERLAEDWMPPPARAQWNAFKARIGTATGASADEVLQAIGPDVLAITDAAGRYWAVKVRDQGKLDALLARLAEHAGSKIQEHTVGRQQIRYLSLPAIEVPEMLRRQAGNQALALLGRLRTRLYWVADGGYLYVAATPQTLIDRARLGAQTSVAQWLSQTQRMDLSTALIGGTGSVQGLPRRLYQAYLKGMQALADIAEAKYDIFAMPTADQLDLPQRSSFGAALNMGRPLVSLELSYESDPFELLAGGNGAAAAAAMLGITAAIAIPAYQNYTIRAQVAEGLNLAAAVRASVAQSLARGRVPANRAAAGLAPDPHDTSGRYVESVDIAGGQVVVRYGKAANAALAGKSLVLTPYRGASGGVVWVCGYAAPPPGAKPVGSSSAGTSVVAKYLPSACR